MRRYSRKELLSSCRYLWCPTLQAKWDAALKATKGHYWQCFGRIVYSDRTKTEIVRLDRYVAISPGEKHELFGYEEDTEKLLAKKAARLWAQGRYDVARDAEWPIKQKWILRFTQNPDLYKPICERP